LELSSTIPPLNDDLERLHQMRPKSKTTQEGQSGRSLHLGDINQEESLNNSAPQKLFFVIKNSVFSLRTLIK